MRRKLASCTGTRIRPKWSITIEARTCPVRISPIVVAAPRRGVRIIEARTNKAPSRPPVHAHHGALATEPGSDLCTTSAATPSATATTTNEIAAAARGPADEGPQLAVDAELHGQDDSGRERDRQQDPGHPRHYRGS